MEIKHAGIFKRYMQFCPDDCPDWEDVKEKGCKVPKEVIEKLKEVDVFITGKEEMYKYNDWIFVFRGKDFGIIFKLI